eukprot:9884824-Prorocentrum_lima.AAC.1
MDQPGGHLHTRLNFYPETTINLLRTTLEEETPLIALKVQCQAKGADIVASLQDAEDPAVL